MSVATVLRRKTGKHRPGRASRSPDHRPPPARPATVVVRPEVLRTIARSCARSDGLETGGPLIGLIHRSWSAGRSEILVQVLGTVPPAPWGRAGSAWVALGRQGEGERAASALRWWRAVTELDLRHLGDWHRHLGGRPAPSAGDRTTVTAMWGTSGLPLWLTAVAVGQSRAAGGTECGGNLIRLAADVRGEWEIGFHRAAPGARLDPVAVRPEGWAIPGLPPLPWHITDPSRWATECRLLAGAGWRVAVDPRRPDRRLGITLRLSVDGRAPITVLTGLRYPAERPAILDPGGRARAVDQWSPARFLVDLVPHP